MAKSINKAILKGRIGADPEVTYTATKRAKCSFSVATDESWKDKSGEWKKITDWTKVAVWGELAEIVAAYVKKGDLVLVEGKIKTRSYEDKDKVKKWITEVVADDVDLIQAWPKSEKAGPDVGDGDNLPF